MKQWAKPAPGPGCPPREARGRAFTAEYKQRIKPMPLPKRAPLARSCRASSVVLTEPDHLATGAHSGQ